jgi:hypothetical protein
MELAKARIDWAGQCIDNFIRQADAFLQDGPYEMVKQAQDDGSGNFQVTFSIKVLRGPPHAVRFACGDAIHNLRAIIDNLVWALASSAGIAKKHRNLGLEFYETKDKFVEKYLYKIESFPPNIISWIEHEQPYNRPDELHILHCINRLWNEDKHRAPILMASAVPGVGLGENMKRFQSFGCGDALEDADVVAVATVSTTRDVKNCNPQFVYDIALAKSSPAHDVPARSFLRRTHQYIIDQVLPKFEPLLS